MLQKRLTTTHKSRLLGIAKGGANAPPRSRFCTPLATKAGHENLKIGHENLDTRQALSKS